MTPRRVLESLSYSARQILLPAIPLAVGIKAQHNIADAEEAADNANKVAEQQNYTNMADTVNIMTETYAAWECAEVFLKYNLWNSLTPKQKLFVGLNLLTGVGNFAFNIFAFGDVSHTAPGHTTATATTSVATFNLAKASAVFFAHNNRSLADRALELDSGYKAEATPRTAVI